MDDKDRIRQLEYDMIEMRTIVASIPEVEEARVALSGISGSLGYGSGSNTTTLLQYVERVKDGLDAFTNSTIANNQRLEARTLALETAARELETALAFEDSNAPWSEHGDDAYDRVKAARAALKALLP